MMRSDDLFVAPKVVVVFGDAARKVLSRPRPERIEHVDTPKPLGKRAKRRAKGKGRAGA